VTPTATTTSAVFPQKNAPWRSSCPPAVFFAYGVAHATGGNPTDADRAGVALHFINAAVDQEAQGGFTYGRRPYLTGPQASGGRAEYGVTVAGTWEREVARVLGEWGVAPQC
jgi:ectoine hydroxylase-related dioxygenase (phytanoyl-CoA dioxygenase family)